MQERGDGFSHDKMTKREGVPSRKFGNTQCWRLHPATLQFSFSPLNDGTVSTMSQGKKKKKKNEHITQSTPMSAQKQGGEERTRACILFPLHLSRMLEGSLKGPSRLCTSTARTAKWYLWPSTNWVRVQAMGSGRARTSPTFFQCEVAGGLFVSW